eukprot:TRINITY_DN771_c0_g1_i1.p2 TRINITY_DN771_c0_g1~~TRINITY_DN771_c0_g1_i1.p2  ORF type:complete len:114 (-),score=20.36 TRINITY_DN771_c0_g1_i1:40-381(-)
MALRVTYRRHCTYRTKSNKFRLVRVAGGNVKMQYRKKRVAGPRAPQYLGHQRLAGTKALRQFVARKASKNQKVSRPYGGILTHSQLRDRVVRAFLIEEGKIVKSILKKKGLKA